MSIRKVFYSLFALILVQATTALSQMIPVPETLWRLVDQEDTDDDLKITIHDQTTPFEVRDKHGNVVTSITDVYSLSVLLQELKRAEDQHRNEIGLTNIKLDEPIVARTHRLIKEYYWNALTRRIDADHIDEVVPDSKVASGSDYIYVPASDGAAVQYFRTLEQQAAQQQRVPALKVVVLPPSGEITGEYVRSLDGQHGILSLKLDMQGRKVQGVPYVVPGGRFNELYYWDSYFIVLGLLEDGRADLAQGMAENMIYEIEHYGKVPNANRTYYLTRSQPPFLTSIIRALYDAGVVDKTWLASALKAAVAEYRNVWLGKEHLVTIGRYQLSRYYDIGYGPAPEVEPGHYDEKIAPWLAQAAVNNPLLTPVRFLNEYLYCGNYAQLTADGLTLAEFFKHDRAVRESGHDTTHRFDDRTADFVTVDLNSLLYKYENDFAEIIEKEFQGNLPSLGRPFDDPLYWRNQARLRREAMLDLMWDPERGYFFDYDFVNKKRSTYISATGLFPLWAKLLDTRERRRLAKLVAYALEHLEENSGLAATAQVSVASASRHDLRQWDYPFGWPPHQMLAWQGLRNYGFDADAGRLAYRWLYTIAKNAHDYNGTIPEKYNVVTGSHAVFVEYGNVGTKFAYITPEGFGWMNASFQVGMRYLSPRQLAELNRLKPPPPIPLSN